MSNRSLPGTLFLALLLLAAPAAFAGDALSLIPIDATTVGMVSLSDVRNSPLSGRLLMETDQLSADGDAARFMAESGLKPSEDVDRMIVAVSPQKDGKPQPLVLFEGRFDPARLSAAAAARGAVRTSTTAGEYLLLPHSGDDNGAVAFVDPHLVIAGSEASVVRALSDRAAGGTPFFEKSGLGREYGRIERNATSWLLVDVQRSARFKSGPDWAEASKGQTSPFAGAMKTVAAVALWAADDRDVLRFGGSAISYDSETRQLLEDTVRGMIAGWRLAVQEKNPELVPILRKFEIGQTGDSVVFSGSLPADALKNWAARAKCVPAKTD